MKKYKGVIYILLLFLFSFALAARAITYENS